jgi:catechol 2,3-dioxygenase-like lactoylglutathione lyase family enzyme
VRASTLQFDERKPEVRMTSRLVASQVPELTFDKRKLSELADADPTTPKVIGFNSTSVTIKNMGRSLRFYVDIFGYTVIGPPKTGRSPLLDRLLGLKDAVYKIATIQPPNTTHIFTDLIEIISPRPPDNDDPHAVYTGRMHQALEVTDAGVVFAQLQAAGVDSISPGAVGNLVAYMLDPDGAIVEVVSAPPPTLGQ